MTKKDYVKIANVLAEFKAASCNNGKVDFNELVCSLAVMFVKDNPRFDRQRFYDVVYDRFYDAVYNRAIGKDTI